MSLCYLRYIEISVFHPTLLIRKFHSSPINIKKIHQEDRISNITLYHKYADARFRDRDRRAAMMVR